MEKHSVLARQLKRCSLNESECPKTIEQWQQFLERVNRAYIDLDQERYLSERSQKVSSREMLELYSELQEAQRIAQLGSWVHDLKTGKITASPMACRVIGFDPASPPTLRQLVETIYPEDRLHFEKQIKALNLQGISFETELRVKVDDTIRWVHINGEAYKSENNSIEKVHGIVMDITARKRAQEKEKKLNKRLLLTAREAGMADVATSVLHNIGNILNSVNVSATLLNEKLHNSKIIQGFTEVNNALKEHANDLATYLTEDPRGKHLPKYLLLLEKTLQDEEVKIATELESLTNNIQHIKDVVSMQQTLGKGVLGLVESISLVEQIEAALAIVGFDPSYIIEPHYGVTELVSLDRTKLAQILVNLTRNAKDALMEGKTHEKKIIFITQKIDDKIQIQIIDNGIGIAPENITKIFSFGFSTKKSGHGFGLHMSALLAKEMGDRLKQKVKGWKKERPLYLNYLVISLKQETHHE